MKVLGLSAGMKDGSNDSLCKEALMGAKEAGAEIEFIRILDLDIKPCTGCIACVMKMMNGKGNACVIKDDLQWLYDKMLEADGVIFAAPIFEKGTHGVVRCIMDRCGPRNDRGNCIIADKIAQEKPDGVRIDPRLLKDRAISFMGIGGSDWATRVECDHGILAMTPKWTVIENICFSWSKHILVQNEKIERAHRLGVRLAEAAADIENATYQGEPGVCPHCHSKEFHLTPRTNKATCCLCGIEGEFVIENGALVFTYDEEWETRAHDTISGKFIHCDDIRDMETKLLEIKKTDIYKERTQKYKDFITATPKPQ
jgi:hypothetical protein